MTQRMIVLCAAAVMFVAAASSCYSQTQVGQMINGVPVITVDVDSLKTWMASQFEPGTIISDVTIQIHGTTFDLVGRGMNGPHSRVIALDIDRVGEVFWTKTITVTNSCSGGECEYCDFVRNGAGSITGCDCAGWGGTCNHARTATETINK